MPNWCNNRLVVTGDEKLLKKFLKKVKDKKGGFTFSILVPIPAELNITSGSTVDNARAVIRAEDGDWTEVDKFIGYPAWRKSALIEDYMPQKEQRKKMLAYMKDGADMEQGRQSFINEKKYGCKDWYQWSIRNWGTKWDAAESSIEDMLPDWIEINFDTAWGPPIEWVLAVEEIFPALNFQLHYDEPGMAFKGVYSCGNNQVINY